MLEAKLLGMDSEGSEQQEEAEFGWAVFPLAVWSLNFCLLWTRSSLTAFFLLAEAGLALLMLVVAFAVIIRQRRLPSSSLSLQHIFCPFQLTD